VFQDKASQFRAAGMINTTSPMSSINQQKIYSCLRCGALVLEVSREQHLEWHILLINDFLNVASWLDPGEV